MFERFTERARQVVVLAQEEARTLKHDHVGAEHILLGLLRAHDGIAARVLESFDITIERVRGEVVRIVGVGQAVTSGQMPFTPEAKHVLELSLREAIGLGHNYIGTEHILLAVLTLGEGVSARILLDCGAESEQIREAVIRTASPPPAPAAEPAVPNAPPPSGNGFEEWIRVGPGAGLRRLLMVAAARALDDGRDGVQPRDVLLALTRDQQIGPALAELGVDDAAILRVLERHQPPEASTSA
ncbi:MAG TPA: Clp protease N-terminal domain-containing protein [Solirubrobacteraceae bacterium]|nr:Clp protease N-terminal domain-containing protein [Solirubrobacteraceae bacterium]